MLEAVVNYGPLARLPPDRLLQEGDMSEKAEVDTLLAMVMDTFPFLLGTTRPRCARSLVAQIGGLLQALHGE